MRRSLSAALVVVGVFALAGCPGRVPAPPPSASVGSKTFGGDAAGSTASPAVVEALRANFERVYFAFDSDALVRRLELVRRYGPGNLVVAASRALLGGEEAELPPGVIGFAEILSPRKVIAAAEAVATRAG